MNELHNTNNLSWQAARDSLVAAVVSLGFPAELGEAAARHLGSPKAIDRMTKYLHYARPADAETIVDEMLAIRAEIDAWKEKKAALESNRRYNELLYYGLEEEGDADKY